MMRAFILKGFNECVEKEKPVQVVMGAGIYKVMS